MCSEPFVNADVLKVLVVRTKEPLYLQASGAIPPVLVLLPENRELY